MAAIFVHTHLNIHDITLTFPGAGYALECSQLRASFPESKVECSAIRLRPLNGDEPFFAASHFRRTRFNVTIRECLVLGVAWRELLQGEAYHARSIELQGTFVDTLMNRDKPLNPHPRAPFTPRDILVLLRKPVTIESIKISRTRLNLGLRRQVASRPGVLTFGNPNIVAEHISTDGKRQAEFEARGNLMDAATLRVTMAIPLASPTLSLHYAGSLGSMDMTKLNPFMDVAGHTHINSGFFEEGDFLIDVTDEHAKGQVRLLYRDLDVAVITNQTDTEGEVLSDLESFFLNNMALRRNNYPHLNRGIAIGRVDDTRGLEERFPHFLWFALRDGIFDQLGLNNLKRPR